MSFMEIPGGSYNGTVYYVRTAMQPAAVQEHYRARALAETPPLPLPVRTEPDELHPGWIRMVVAAPAFDLGDMTLLGGAPGRILPMPDSPGLYIWGRPVIGAIDAILRNLGEVAHSYLEMIAPPATIGLVPGHVERNKSAGLPVIAIGVGVVVAVVWLVRGMTGRRSRR